ncbi:MAG: glycosyltransferase family 2 protein [Coleofasciculaceae cyanobacterium]
MPIINTILTLKDLPPPLPGATGWPWTEQSQPLPKQIIDASKLPRISIITPSYNQGKFIEETIRSVLLQGYPNVEYIIIDGGSTDRTIEVIQKYQKYIAYWISESDQGQADAINKGFLKATGDLIGWQNSDDYYYPDAFIYAAQGAIHFQEYDVFYGSRNFINLDGKGSITKDNHMSAFDLEQMIPNTNMSNQSAFFRKNIFQEGNLINKTFNHCMDHEFFWRLVFQSYKFIFIPEINACYRLHPDCKGQQLNNDWLIDTLRICKLVYQNSDLPSTVRRQAWSFLRGACLDHYGKLRLNHFHRSLYDLVAFKGLMALDIELVIKYLLSCLGISNLKLIRKIITSTKDQVLPNINSKKDY